MKWQKNKEPNVASARVLLNRSLQSAAVQLAHKRTGDVDLVISDVSEGTVPNGQSITKLK